MATRGEVKRGKDQVPQRTSPHFRFLHGIMNSLNFCQVIQLHNSIQETSCSHFQNLVHHRAPKTMIFMPASHTSFPEKFQLTFLKRNICNVLIMELLPSFSKNPQSVLSTLKCYLQSSPVFLDPFMDTTGCWILDPASQRGVFAPAQTSRKIGISQLADEGSHYKNRVLGVNKSSKHRQGTKQILKCLIKPPTLAFTCWVIGRGARFLNSTRHKVVR